MAREERDVDRGALHVLQASAEVEDGVGLRVDDVAVLVVEGVVAVAPGEGLIRYGVRRAVVAHGEYAMVGIGYAGTDLGVGVLAAELCGKSHPHEELVPGNHVAALLCHVAASSLEIARRGTHPRTPSTMKQPVPHCKDRTVYRGAEHAGAAPRLCDRCSRARTALPPRQ